MEHAAARRRDSGRQHVGARFQPGIEVSVAIYLTLGLTHLDVPALEHDEAFDAALALDVLQRQSMPVSSKPVGFSGRECVPAGG